MSQGFSFETFAAKIRVNRNTLQNWVSVYPEWAEAKEMAFDACQLFWEKLGIDHVVNTSEYDGATKSSVSKSLNSSVWSLNMKNRFGWRDRQPGEEDKVIVNNHGSKSMEEIEARIATLSKKPEEPE